MSEPLTGPIAAEIHRRLTEALNPIHLVVRDDSDMHLGHAGHDGRGESHFTVEIVARSFEGESRLARQRAVNRALAPLLHDRVHALAIKTKAPSEL